MKNLFARGFDDFKLESENPRCLRGYSKKLWRIGDPAAYIISLVILSTTFDVLLAAAAWLVFGLSSAHWRRKKSAPVSTRCYCRRPHDVEEMIRNSSIHSRHHHCMHIKPYLEALFLSKEKKVSTLLIMHLFVSLFFGQIARRISTGGTARPYFSFL